ncbi:uncharacterized protein LOC142329475 [Lycorma delicatula]|uniref:uncharacterized protein LOC142329475 n=1 Tax=Lycorma delicatula TaxID=130591 RepID=UPI003F516755
MSEEMFPVNDAQLEQVVYDVLQEDDELEGTPNQRLQLLIPRRLVYGEVDDQQHHPLLDDGNDNLIAEAAADVENNESEESTVVTTSCILENRVRFTKFHNEQEAYFGLRRCLNAKEEGEYKMKINIENIPMKEIDVAVAKRDS